MRNLIISFISSKYRFNSSYSLELID